MRRSVVCALVGALVVATSTVVVAGPVASRRDDGVATPYVSAALAAAQHRLVEAAARVTDDADARWLPQAQSNIDAARSLSAMIESLRPDGVDTGIALAAEATLRQRRALSADMRRSVAARHHASVAAAATELAARYGMAPRPEQVAALRALDMLPDPIAGSLTRMIETFVVFDDETRAATAGKITPAGFDRVLYARNELLAAVAEFEDAATASQPRAAGIQPIALCPALVIDLGATANEYFNDCALMIDGGGSDTYRNNAGGGSTSTAGLRCPPRSFGTVVPAAAVIDLEGDDTYAPLYAGAPRNCGVNGGGDNGAGFLFDAAGDDVYEAGESGTNGGALHGAGFLLDAGGHDTVSAGSFGTNGGAYAGSGMLVNVGGDDVYRSFFMGQMGYMGVNGGAYISGVGSLIDTEGNDSYLAGESSSNGAAHEGTGLLLDGGSGTDRYTGGNGRVEFVGAGLLLDAGGSGDVYNQYEYGGVDRTVVPKGTFGAQIDVIPALPATPTVPPVPTPPVTLSPAFVSDDCDAGTNVIAGHVADAYLKLRTAPAPADASTTFVCVAAESGATHLGGRLAVGGVGASLPVAVDQDAGSVAACGAKPSNVRVQSGNFLNQPYWVDVTPAPVGSTDAAWVCVRFTNSVALRLRLTGNVVPSGTPTFVADPATPHVPAYAEAAWPSSGPSAACAAAAGGRTRYVDVTVGSTPIALYGWQESPSRSHLCLRGGGAGGAGGRLTVDGGSGVAVSPVVRTSYDTSACSLAVVTRDEAPTYGLYVSDPATPTTPPVSACAEVAGAELSVSLVVSGSSNPSWTADPA